MFLVLGIPRSRTAWLSVFLECYHEGIDGCSSLLEYKNKVEGVGDCNTGLAIFDFGPYFEDWKKIIIHRPITRSLVNFCSDINGLSFDANLDFLIWHKNRLCDIAGLHIELEEIDDNLQAIWEEVKDSNFDKNRADRLIKLNVQVKNPLGSDYDAIKEIMRNERCLYPTKS